MFKLINKAKKRKAWYLDLKIVGDGQQRQHQQPVGTISNDGDVNNADITLTMTDENFSKLVAGKVNAQRLYLSGQLKVYGNVMKAAAIEQVLKSAKRKAKL